MNHFHRHCLYTYICMNIKQNVPQLSTQIQYFLVVLAVIVVKEESVPLQVTSNSDKTHKETEFSLFLSNLSKLPNKRSLLIKSTMKLY